MEAVVREWRNTAGSILFLRSLAAGTVLLVCAAIIARGGGGGEGEIGIGGAHPLSLEQLHTTAVVGRTGQLYRRLVNRVSSILHGHVRQSLGGMGRLQQLSGGDDVSVEKATSSSQQTSAAEAAVEALDTQYQAAAMPGGTKQELAAARVAVAKLRQQLGEVEQKASLEKASNEKAGKAVASNLLAAAGLLGVGKAAEKPARMTSLADSKENLITQPGELLDGDQSSVRNRETLLGRAGGASKLGEPGSSSAHPHAHEAPAAGSVPSQTSHDEANNGDEQSRGDGNRGGVRLGKAGGPTGLGVITPAANASKTVHLPPRRMASAPPAAPPSEPYQSITPCGVGERPNTWYEWMFEGAVVPCGGGSTGRFGVWLLMALAMVILTLACMVCWSSCYGCVWMYRDWKRQNAMGMAYEDAEGGAAKELIPASDAQKGEEAAAMAKQAPPAPVVPSLRPPSGGSDAMGARRPGSGGSTGGRIDARPASAMSR